MRSWDSSGSDRIFEHPAKATDSGFDHNGACGGNPGSSSFRDRHGASPMNAAAALLYFVSGATGLCYEVLWARMISAQFGASTFGIAATVTAFLLGLGIGSVIAARVGGTTPGYALRAFALLEGTVALYALALPAIVALGAPHLEALAPILGWGSWSALQGAIAVVLLGLPAAAMGASFPMIVRALPAGPLWRRGTGDPATDERDPGDRGRGRRHHGLLELHVPSLVDAAGR